MSSLDSVSCMLEITKDIIKEVYQERPADSHKYDYGQVIIVGGSRLYSGAPAFSALAALRSGVDMVRLLAPERAANIIATFGPDLIAFPLQGDYLSKKHASDVLAAVESAKAIRADRVALLMGGGMGRSEEVQKTIQKIVGEVDIPMVLDADAIYAVGKQKGVCTGKNIVFTPHDFEFFALTGMTSKDTIGEERYELVKKGAQELCATIILKGAEDVISDGNEVAVNKTGNAYMTKGGTGDALAGICGGLIAQGIAPFKAACAAAYVSGRAGDIVASRKKQSLLASDVVEAIAEAIND